MELRGVRSSIFKGKVAFNISLSRQGNAQLFLFVQCGLQMWFHCRLHIKVEKKTCFDGVKLQRGNLELEKKRFKWGKKKAVHKRACKLEEWIRTAEFLWPRSKEWIRFATTEQLSISEIWSIWYAAMWKTRLRWRKWKLTAWLWRCVSSWLKERRKDWKESGGWVSVASGISYISVLQLNRFIFFMNHWSWGTTSLGLMWSWEALT